MESYGSFKFLFTLCQIFGLFPFGLKLSNQKFVFVESRYWLAYTKILFSIFFLLQLHLLYCFWNWSYQTSVSLASQVVMSLSMLSLWIILPTIFFTILTKKKDFLFWSNHIGDMTTDFSCINYKNLNRFNTKLLVITLTFFSVVGFVETHFVSNAEKKLMMPRNIGGRYEWFALIYLLILYEANMFLHYFISFVYILGEVYRITNRDLRENGQQGKKYWIHRLRELRLRDWHGKDFVDFLHSYYIPVVSLYMCWGLAATIFNLAVSNPLDSPIVSVLRFGYLITDVITVTCVCYQTEQEAKKTLLVLQELFITYDDVELKEELEIFSLQAQHKKIEFNALGLCKLDFTLVTSIVSTITSYIVILVQFQNDHKKEGEFKRLVMNCTINNDTSATGY